MKANHLHSILPNTILKPEQAISFLELVLKRMLHAELQFGPEIEKVHENFQISIRNLLHYLVLRSEEVRPLQDYLHERGLSSLSNSESHTFSQLVQTLRWLSDKTDFTPYQSSSVCDYNTGMDLLNRHTQQLLGPNTHSDYPHIMVTFSSDMAEDRKIVQDLLMAGMTVARINCAHDGPVVWEKMIDILKKACAKTGKGCKIYMDLAGPKIRVSEIISKNGKEEKSELMLAEGDKVRLVEKKPKVKIKATQDSKGKEPKQCALLVVQPKGLIAMMKKGEHIFFDDGKFEARIIANDGSTADVEIMRISTKKPVLKAQKGVNLPDSDLNFSPLTDEDINCLPFICKHADMVGYSFVGLPTDVEQLRGKMLEHTQEPPAIILKIERLAAVQNLPHLLINGMRDARLGVMIARGDLAVEIGFERLSEIQQEILWICEAAHVPVIWATQVLETMNKTGFATRSEISDASMGIMAECVMLNKGPHVVKTVETLADILTRLSGHMDKKRYIHRPLSIARSFLKG
jgi:pyruvate kinase